MNYHLIEGSNQIVESQKVQISDTDRGIFIGQVLTDEQIAEIKNSLTDCPDWKSTDGLDKLYSLSQSFEPYVKNDTAVQLAQSDSFVWKKAQSIFNPKWSLLLDQIVLPPHGGDDPVFLVAYHICEKRNRAALILCCSNAIALMG